MRTVYVGSDDSDYFLFKLWVDRDLESTHKLGFKPASAQPTLDWLILIAAAIEARLQCVTFADVALAVFASTLKPELPR
jgi:hypothetical protein